MIYIVINNTGESFKTSNDNDVHNLINELTREATLRNWEHYTYSEYIEEMK